MSPTKSVKGHATEIVRGIVTETGIEIEIGTGTGIQGGGTHDTTIVPNPPRLIGISPAAAVGQMISTSLLEEGREVVVEIGTATGIEIGTGLATGRGAGNETGIVSERGRETGGGRGAAIVSGIGTGREIETGRAGGTARGRASAGEAIKRGMVFCTSVQIFCSFP